VTIVAVACLESGSVANCEGCGRFCFVVEIMVGICFAVKSLSGESQ
jgi:hypothetical protein